MGQWGVVYGCGMLPGGMRAIATYDERVAAEPRLRSVVLPLDDDGMDGFAISAVVSA